MARAVVDAGADGLTAVNTLGPGMVIDVRARGPVLSNLVGGVSGAPLRPIAVRCVYEISQAVDVPIIGTGGVLSGEDALQMIMAGATAVGIGTALYHYGAGAFARIHRGWPPCWKKRGSPTSRRPGLRPCLTESTWHIASSAGSLKARPG